MDDLIKHWKAGKTKRAKTVDEYTSIAQQFKTYYTEGRKIARLSSVTKDDVVAFRDQLFADGQHYKTVRKKIGALNTLFLKALGDSKISENPCAGVKVETAEQEDRPREIFSVEDLRLVFTSRIYTDGHQPAGCGGDAFAWAGLIALLTGMRIEEICQLRVADLAEDVGLGFYIRVDDEDGKKLKSVWARRNVPVHPELVRLGFVDFILAKRARAERLVFPELELDKYQRSSSRLSKVWNAELREILGITEGRSRRTFHSFRHTFKHYCRACRIPEDVHDALTGHRGGKEKTVSRAYGHKFYPRAPLFEEIRRYAIDGLDLTALKVPAFPPAI
jgi:integrase